MGIILSGGGGGPDWSSMNYNTNAPTGTAHLANTHMDITGSGYLVTVNGIAGASYDNWAFQIDGGTIYVPRLYNEGNHNYFPIRFNSSLKMTCEAPATDTIHVWVVLD